MSQHERLHWLVCYDIRDPRRLARVHRALKKEGLPVQYSVFMLHASTAGVKRVLYKLEGLIDSHQDDVRAYPVPTHPWKVVLGADIVPREMWLQPDRSA
jgi:CRISPR-associated protein Cas2